DRMVTSGQTLYFTTDGGTQLWKTNAAGTVLIKTFASGPNAQSTLMTAMPNGIVYLVVNNHELWQTDGTAVSTVRVADVDTRVVRPGAVPGLPAGMAGMLAMSLLGIGGIAAKRRSGRRASKAVAI